MTFFVPLPEAQVIDTFETLTGNNADSIIDNVVSIISTQDSAVIAYDHWEDGFESDARDPVQATTEVWGDGTASNGCAGARNLTQGTVSIEYVDRPVTTIAGAVFNDTNNNGAFDAGESGLTNL